MHVSISIISTLIVLLFLSCVFDVGTQGAVAPSKNRKNTAIMPSNWNWETSMKFVLTRLVLGIPEVGAFISAVVSTFWPTWPGKPDIWSTIKEQVEGLVDKKLLEKELEDRASELHGLGLTMARYARAKVTEKGSLLSAILADCDWLNAELSGSKNNIHSVPITITLAFNHLAMLRERVMYGKAMYGEDNTKVWVEELNNAYQMYQEYLSDTYYKWQAWRGKQITTRAWLELTPLGQWNCYGSISDRVTSYEHEFSNSGICNLKMMQDDVRRRKLAILNKDRGEFMKSYHLSFEIARFLLGQENRLPYSKPRDRDLELGPYFTIKPIGPMWYDSGSPHWNGTQVTAILVRSYNSIDALQFSYGERKGVLTGNPEGGAKHFLSLGDRTLTGITMGFHDQGYGEIAEISFQLSDNSTFGPYGNKGKWKISNERAGYFGSSQFQCLDIGMLASLPGPSGTIGIKQMSFIFRHVSSSTPDIGDNYKSKRKTTTGKYLM